MKRRRIFIVIAIILVIVTTILIAAYLLVTRDTDMRIKRLMDGAVPTVADFEHSRLRLNENGTFEIEIIKYGETKDETKIFAGIGTYTRNGNEYSFYFYTAQTTRDNVNAPDAEYEFKTHEYSIDRKTDWLVFFDHMGDPYHFG